MHIPKTEDLFKIASFLIKEGYYDSDITVTIPVPDKTVLNAINEDLYYRTKEKTNNETYHDKDIDEAELNINNIRFRYYIMEEGQ